MEDSDLAAALFDDPSNPPRSPVEALTRAAKILEAATRQNERILTLLQRLDEAVVSLETVIRGAIVGRDAHDQEADRSMALLRAELERLRLSLDSAVAAQGRVKLWRYEGPVWVLVSLGCGVGAVFLLGRAEDLAGLIRVFTGR